MEVKIIVKIVKPPLYSYPSICTFNKSPFKVLNMLTFTIKTNTFYEWATCFTSTLYVFL